MTDTTKYTFLGDDSGYSKSNTTRYIILIASLTFVLFLFLLVFHFVKNSQETKPEENKNFVRKDFKNYFVIFDKKNNRPVSSTQFGWINDTDENKPKFQPEPSITNIKHDDFTNNHIFQRGHLSPWPNLGLESFSVINMVPQYPCHNDGKWKYFEAYVRKYYFGKTVVTIPIYEKNLTHVFSTKTIDIPSQFCKEIQGLEGRYCMNHTIDCGPKPYINHWCQNFNPEMKLPHVNKSNCKY
jgi:DNA/RNA endonuclease G (NUC1)